MYRVKQDKSLNKTNCWETQVACDDGQTSIQEFKSKAVSTHDRQQTKRNTLQAATQYTELNWTRGWTVKRPIYMRRRWNQNSGVKLQRIVNRTTVDILCAKNHIARRETMYRVNLNKILNTNNSWRRYSHATTGPLTYRTEDIASRKTVYRVKQDKRFNYTNRWETTFACDERPNQTAGFEMQSGFNHTNLDRTTRTDGKAQHNVQS